MARHAEQTADPSRGPLLSLRGVSVRYGGVIAALHAVSLDVPPGRIVALLGANGAGKSTTLKAASRLLSAERGEVVAGSVWLGGEPVDRLAPERLVARGVAHVLEGRRCFAHLTVEENLRTGALARRLSRGALEAALEQVYTRFPRLKERRRSPAGLTSGGEQQMVAIGRALLSAPRLLLLDEPSMGLAPRIVEEIFTGLRELNRQDGLSLLLAEQNAVIALREAHDAAVLEGGRIVLQGAAAELAARDDIQHFYLGGPTEDRRPFIDAHRVRTFQASA